MLQDQCMVSSLDKTQTRLFGCFLPTQYALVSKKQPPRLRRQSSALGRSGMSIEGSSKTTSAGKSAAGRSIDVIGAACGRCDQWRVAVATYTRHRIGRVCKPVLLGCVSLWFHQSLYRLILCSTGTATRSYRWLQDCCRWYKQLQYHPYHHHLFHSGSSEPP